MTKDRDTAFASLISSAYGDPKSRLIFYSSVLVALIVVAIGAAGFLVWLDRAALAKCRSQFGQEWRRAPRIEGYCLGPNGTLKRRDSVFSKGDAHE